MDADIFITLTHFKGHEATGFGGTFKNIGMGGGSMMDAAKAVAFCAVNGGDVNDYISGGKQGTGCCPFWRYPPPAAQGARPTPLRC